MRADRLRNPRLRWRISQLATLGPLALLLLATAAFRCPGPKPTAPATGDGGGGPGGAGSSTFASSTSDAVTSTGGDDGDGGDGLGGDGLGGGGQGGCDPETIDSDPLNCGACGRPCETGDGVVAARCDGGVCTSTCESGLVNLAFPPGDDADDGCETEGQRVFVTSAAFDADFGGVAMATLACQALADDADLGGQWSVWLSDGLGASPDADLIHSEDPYFLVEGTQVADDWDELVNSFLDHAIDLDERGNPAVDRRVWTATLPDGSPFPMPEDACGAWTSVGVSATGVTGLTAERDDQWTSGGVVPCNSPDVRLYCFEQ